MRAVVQRVTNAQITVNGGAPRAIGAGLVILVGVRSTDTPADCDKLAAKCAALRIFDDENGNLNRSACELGYEALVVSNFTLYGDSKRGNRPSFIAAAKPPLSVELYERFVEQLRGSALKNIVTGEFGAEMQISLVNDGPVTLVLDTDEWRTQT